MENRIKDLRIDNDLSKKALAELLQINPKTLFAYEKGQIAIPDYVLVNLSKKFNVSIDYILKLTPLKRLKHDDLKDKLKSIANDLESMSKAL